MCMRVLRSCLHEFVRGLTFCSIGQASVLMSLFARGLLETNRSVFALLSMLLMLLLLPLLVNSGTVLKWAHKEQRLLAWLFRFWWP